MAERTKDQIKYSYTWEGIYSVQINYFTNAWSYTTLLLIWSWSCSIILNIIFLETGWIFWSINFIYRFPVLHLWLKLSPIQKKIVALGNTDRSQNLTWDDYNKLAKQWDVWGSIATITPWIAVILMVIKPNI